MEAVDILAEFFQGAASPQGSVLISPHAREQPIDAVIVSIAWNRAIDIGERVSLAFRLHLQTYY